jgi:hypothetical protein
VEDGREGAADGAEVVMEAEAEVAVETRDVH